MDDLCRYPVFRVVFPSDLSKYHVVHLPLLPLPPWEPPEDRRSAVDKELKKNELS